MEGPTPGGEPPADARWLARIRSQASRIAARSLASGVALTILVVLIALLLGAAR